jgi:hypothetical protein
MTNPVLRISAMPHFLNFLISVVGKVSVTNSVQILDLLTEFSVPSPAGMRGSPILPVSVGTAGNNRRVVMEQVFFVALLAG